MKHDRETLPKAERRGTRLAASFSGALVVASAVILLSGAAGWWLLRTTRQEIQTVRQADNGNMTAMADSLSRRVDELDVGILVAVVLGILVVVGLYLYLMRVVIRPLHIHTRLMSRLAIGASNEDVPAALLARDDEMGALARAIRDVIAYQREEVHIANTMATGDFTGTVAVRDPADALGQALRRMTGVTMATLRRVTAHAEQVMDDCEAIALASGKLAANNSDITSAMTEISTSITQIRTHADDNAGIAEQVGRLASNGNHSVERGYEDIGEMGVVMLNMQACGDKIVRIAKSIGDIAFQTNLLALNASVEAARAGKNGKGFTVVAEEVRNLAVRTSKAAEETSTLMQETVEQVELAAAIAGRINATFAEMQANNEETDALLAKIAAASRDQTGGIDQISATLRQVDQSTRKNSEYTEDISEKADSLIGKTDELGRLMGHFRLDYDSPSDSVPPPVKSATATLGVRAPRAIQHMDPE